MPPAATHLYAKTTDEPVDALLALIATAHRRASQSPLDPGRAPFDEPVVLIDGRSGSGKSDLATALAAAWPGAAATLVRLDDIYPGWRGLDAASSHVHDELLAAPRPRWQRYDWAAGKAAEWASVDTDRPLIVEGIGTLSRQNATLATFSVWVELDDRTRRERAIARDGDAYEPYWEVWAEQERAFIARENPAALADAIVDFTAR
ncbi:ATP-binding protein [Subtercola sp. YIM 133946]|uniref:ATP-binding protein n=1 Tax=Subtercola sp. YIM 133946 TaxID=3118909 RepID=UPI002F938584